MAARVQLNLLGLIKCCKRCHLLDMTKLEKPLEVRLPSGGGPGRAVLPTTLQKRPWARAAGPHCTAVCGHVVHGGQCAGWGWLPPAVPWICPGVQMGPRGRRFAGMFPWHEDMNSFLKWFP